jgi:predicted outer membrane repeat protein
VGIYSLSNSNEHYPITIDNYLTIQGVGSLLTILDPEGGSRGISVSGDSVRISGLTIRNSKAPFYPDDKGGGLSVNNASLTLNDVVLTGNQASSGGGIYATNSKLIFKGVSIHDNQASRRGGGIYLYQDCQLEFYATDLSNIYSNQAVISGNDLATNFSFLGGSTYAFSVDTFTVADPSDYFAYPSGSFAVSSVNNVFPQYDADLYVSPAGDDGNTGLTSIEPLKTITHALKSIISSSENQHTIHLAEGTYSSSSNEERFPLYLRDGLSMTGQSSENTNLDGEQLTSLIRIYDHSDVSINDLSLKRATDRAIYSYYSSLELNDLLIEKNNADRGAGIYLLGTNLSLSGVTIRYNSGGGLYLGSSTHVVFDPVKRCNIYLNETGDGIGQDIASYQFNEVVNVILDTCTQKYPTLETAAPLEKFSFDILNGIVPQIAHDIYVSPEGNNENSGTSSEDPLQTLSLALDLIYANAENPRKIYLADGVYSPTLTNEIFPLVGKNNVSITGESVENTILDGDSLSRLIALDEISEFKVESLTIRNGYESRGGAISCINSAPVFQSILFLQNRSVVAAGVLEQQESSPVFINCSFVANSSDAGATGVTVFNSPSYPVFINSLVWENGLIPIYAGAGQIILVNTLIERGEASVLGFSQWFGQTIDADPQFVGGEPFSYHLSSSSPGINAGTAFFELDGDTLLNLTIDDFTGDAPDIGALESPYLVSVRPEIQTPYEYSLYQNHPNPFNPSTTISYEIPSASEVTIKIFDLRGREVWSSTENHLNSGKYSFTWWGQDSRGLALGSGVFVVQMRTREYMATRKILLLK